MENNLYPVGARVRVRGRYGNLVAVLTAQPPVYLIEFDNDVIYGPATAKPKPRADLKERRRQTEIAHDQITECIDGGTRIHRPVTLERDLFIALAREDGKSLLTSYSDYYSTKNKHPRAGVPFVPVIEIPTPTWFESSFWMGAGFHTYSSFGESERVDSLQMFPLVPIANYSGEFLTVSKYFEGYTGWRVSCSVGEFVTLDKPMTAYPSAPVYLWEVDDDEPREDETVTEADKVAHAQPQLL